MILLFLLILAVIIAVVFANMTLYVVGGLIGLVIVFVAYVIKRRKQR